MLYCKPCAECGIPNINYTISDRERGYAYLQFKCTCGHTYRVFYYDMNERPKLQLPTKSALCVNTIGAVDGITIGREYLTMNPEPDADYYIIDKDDKGRENCKYSKNNFVI